MSRMLAAWRHAPTHQKVWALAASNLSVPLVALVDSSVIGHLPHAHQLGAVAVGGSLYTLLVWVMGFLRTTGFAAQAAGRQDGARRRYCCGTVAGPSASPAAGHTRCAAQGRRAAADAALGGTERPDRDYFHTRLFGLPAALASYAH